jgi:hypothetical protein
MWTWLPVQGIEKEYGELDTVWFMAGSLFRNYPYDTPTDAFPLKLFREVCTCQGCSSNGHVFAAMYALCYCVQVQACP